MAKQPADAPPPHDEEAAVRRRSLLALDGLNFFIADMLTGFGPFVSVYLVTNGWSQASIGVALSVGTFAAMFAQVPAGMLVDAVPHKRMMIGAGVLAIIAASLLFAWFPARWPVFGIETLLGLSGAMLTPAIAALTLALSHDHKLAERLGGNVRWKAFGSALAALLMGYIGTHVSTGAVFYVSAAFGVVALLCLLAISVEDVETAPKRTQHPTAWPRHARSQPMARRREIWRDPKMLAFCVCIFLFQLGNAGALPFAFSEIQARTHGSGTDTIVSVALIVSQLMAAVVSPGVGRIAHTRGRKIVLFAGIAFLVVRCLVLSVTIDEYVVVALEALDGLTGAIVGVIVPLVIADLTHRGGRFNFAMGVAGLAMILGAGLSTTMTGFIAEHVGAAAAFLALAAAGAAGCLCTLFVMTETARFPLKVVWKGITRHAV